MRKIVCFFIAIYLMFLLAVSVNAQTFETSLSVGKTGSNYVCLDAFVDTDSPICGGEFTLSFDEKVAQFSNIDSDVFDVEACEYNRGVKIVVAKDEGAKLSSGEPVFSVKLSTTRKEDFSVTLVTECLLNDSFERGLPKNSTATVSIESDSTAVSNVPDKVKGKKSIEKDKSTINEKVSVDEDADENNEKRSFLPIKIDGKHKGIGLILAVGLLLITAFLFGLFFKKIMTSKEEEDSTDLE